MFTYRSFPDLSSPRAAVVANSAMSIMQIATVKEIILNTGHMEFLIKSK